MSAGFTSARADNAAPEESIAAIATARGAGGIGIIRVSGGEALRILRASFKSSRGGEVNFAPRRLEYGWALDAQGRPLDEALAVYMPGPHSFTGEDSAEIHCHGGLVVLEAALASVCAHGARPAGPGEFTRRACLNGRLDLSRAEAVAEMIAAPTLQGVRLARNKLAGGLSAGLEELRRLLDRLRALLYAALDFPDLSQEERGDFQPLLNRLRAGLRALAISHDQARVWREGALAVLVGPPNSGKSSLFNALLGRKRALVADLPGTTRDFIEEALNLEGLPLRLADTAGLRDSGDVLENAGMELTRDLMARADIILLVMEAYAAPEAPRPPAGLPASGLPPSRLPLCPKRSKRGPMTMACSAASLSLLSPFTSSSYCCSRPLNYLTRTSEMVFERFAF